VFVENKVVLFGVKTCYLFKGSICLFVNLIVFLHRLIQLALGSVDESVLGSHNKTIYRCVDTPEQGFLDIVIIALTFNSVFFLISIYLN
jgi:hypothetical protein